MNKKLLAGLNESQRDALVPYYLHHVIPGRGLGALASKIKTAEDLYEYLLLDPKVSGQIKTSRIAEAVASTQLYLHRCREQLEPDTVQSAMENASRENGYFSRWNAYNKRYSTWAGLQRLLYYPASYIDPELRYSKTQLFEELETAINQGRITEERAEQAFSQYVSGLRKVLDIRYDAGYQVEPAGERGVAYFLGSIPGTPGEYYWRRVDKTDYGDNSRVRNPALWSQWLKIDAPLQPMQGTVPAIVYFANRLHVLCIHEYPSDAINVGSEVGTLAQAKNIRELQIATLRPSGQWNIRNWPVGINVDGVFAAELRNNLQDPAPKLGVFTRTSKGINVIRFSKILQVLDSPENIIISDVAYNNRNFPDYYDIPVLQPLVWQPPVPPGVFIVTSTFSLELRAGDSFVKLKNLRFINSSGKITVEVLAAQSGSFYPPVAIGYCISGVVIYRRYVNATSSDNDYEINFPFLFTDLVTNTQFSICYILGAFSEDIPLIRSSPGTPARVTSFDPTRHLWIPTSYNSVGRTQMLFTKPANVREYTLTTLAGPFLEQKMLEGVDALLSWDVQQEKVDPTGYAGGTADLRVSFLGGVGLYTWELFFHAPFLIANRLLAEQRFDEADLWFKRIFDPAGYRNADGVLQKVSNKTRYWNVEPLQNDVAWGSSSPIDTDDPDAIATADPMNYKLAVFLRGLELLAARGDQLYRQQTRDSLSEAKMWYVQALQLLGPRPELPLAQAWNAPTLQAASTTSNVQLLDLEGVAEEQLAVLAPASPRQIAITNGPFRPPVDTAVLAYWDRFEGRLYNLRRHLSIDGQPLALELFEAPADPQSAATGTSGRRWRRWPAGRRYTGPVAATLYGVARARA
jgi:hypothetical protein